MRQLRFSLGVLGMLWVYPVFAVMADAPSTAAQPKAADADSGKEPNKAPVAKHKPADAASAAHTKQAATDDGKHAQGDSDAHAKYMTADRESHAKHERSADGAQVKQSAADPGHAMHLANAGGPQPMAASATTTPAKPAPVAPVAAPPVAAAPKPSGPTCSLEEAEQPRGGRLDVLGGDFGQAPVVRIASRPARMIERRADRISVQVPADSNGGAVTLQSEGHSAACGTLVIIGKNR